MTVVSDISQPFFGLPSQSPNPAAHTGAHTPELQIVVPLAFAQAIPHPPQLVTDVCVFVSHPLFGSPSQLAKPDVQLGLQMPDAQAVVPFAFAHASPQAPQFALVRSGASQPFATLLSQLPKLAAQVIVQPPSTQLAAPLLLLQTFPQAPQLLAFVCAFTSQPLEAAPSQFPKPALHVPSVQAPDEHDSEAFARSQTAPQALQSDTVVRLDSQPLGARPSQFPKPDVHAWSAHVPLKHVADAWAKLHA